VVGLVGGDALPLIGAAVVLGCRKIKAAPLRSAASARSAPRSALRARLRGRADDKHTGRKIHPATWAPHRTRLSGPSSSAPMVRVAEPASRPPIGAANAVGCAEPGPGRHSPGIRAYEDEGADQNMAGGLAMTRHPLMVTFPLPESMPTIPSGTALGVSLHFPLFRRGRTA
jgi:hypothetical protein